MKPDELETMLARAITDVGLNRLLTPPPEAKVVTGNPKWDAQLHHVIVEYGVEVELGKNRGVVSYRIVDEQKFVMFLLRWA
jgi:hypothetical protein